ncbi:MAG: 30S ribosomal protein S12 methylthiotransferase RimO [Bacteroidales bacterium]|nr:30S ribosomal protein S12 methylthiotransferase RimO [Bacteroidales bacterium]
MKQPVVDVITMGCSKNLVDSERLMSKLESAGFKVSHNATRLTGQYAVVNTCGFIGDAKEESIQMILELCERKRRGKLLKLFVMGCLSQRYLTELQGEIQEVDMFFGKFDWDGIIGQLGSCPTVGSSSTEQPVVSTIDRHLTTPSHYAYLKISEGCDRHCAYCAIPIITGRHVSRPIPEILLEVRGLVEQGVKEFQVVAQELTYYGVDLYGKQCIAELVEQMAHIPGVEWIRLHYAYPTHFPMDLLRVMRENRNVCRYLDIALQHISTPMLTRMRRQITAEQTYDLLATIRREVPGIHLRTTLMVGFPGETDEDFQQLMQFVATTRFERLGAFAYSEEEGTYSALHYADDVPTEVKRQRLDKLMALQQDISAELAQSKVGSTLRVIIDRREGDYYVGRTEFDSPEVDPEVLVPVAGQQLRCGCFYQVRITKADEFDLYAVVS